MVFMVMKPISKLSSPVLRIAAALGVMLTLASCELPPRESWRIVQRDGLITYWTREYHPETLPTRYLPPSNGGPLVTRYYNTRIPYRTGALGSRYLAERHYPYKVTYQPDYVTRRRTVTQYTTTSYTAQPRVVRESRPERKSAASGAVVVKETPQTRIQVAPPSSPERNLTPDSLPYGTPVPGRPGMVTSPFAEKQQLVDVTGMAVGETVKDPYSGKLFRVPPAVQAKASSTPPTAQPPPAEKKKAP